MRRRNFWWAVSAATLVLSACSRVESTPLTWQPDAAGLIHSTPRPVPPFDAGTTNVVDAGQQPVDDPPPTNWYGIDLDYRLDAGVFNGVCWEPPDGGEQWYGDAGSWYDPNIPCRINRWVGDGPSAPDGLCCQLGLGFAPGSCGGGACWAPLPGFAWQYYTNFWTPQLYGVRDGRVIYSERQSYQGGDCSGTCDQSRFTEVMADGGWGPSVTLGPGGALIRYLGPNGWVLYQSPATLDGSGPWFAYALDGGAPVPVSLAAWLADGFDGGYPFPQFLGGRGDDVELVSTAAGHTRLGRLKFSTMQMETVADLTGFTADSSAVRDELGQLFLHGVDAVDAGSVRAFSNAGALKWELATTGIPSAVFDGTLVLNDGTTRATETGQLLYTWEPAGSAVWLDPQRAIVQTSVDDGTRIQVLDRWTGVRSVDATLPQGIFKTFPAQYGGLLVVTGQSLVAGWVIFAYGDHSLVAWRVGADGPPTILNAWDMGQGSDQNAQLIDSTLVIQELDNQHDNYPGGTPTQFIGLAVPGWSSVEHGWLNTDGYLRSWSPQ